MVAQMIHLVLQCIAICLVPKFVLSVKECKKIDQCTCATDEGEISLKKLAGTDGKARFQDIPCNKKEFKFSWNPCDSFTLSGTACTDVAACSEQMILSVVVYFKVALQNTSDCVLGDNGRCVLTYTAPGLLRSKSEFKVALQCDETVEGTVDPVVSDVTANKHTTVLHSKYACPVSSPSGLSIGSVLVITFCCLLIAYVIGGILFNKYARQVEGKEVFPNYSFWADFPYLVKDGCVFTSHSLRRLCGEGSSRSGYASI